MITIPDQCRELSEKADKLQDHGTFVGYGGATSVDPTMNDAATAMREAGNTILELKVENDELRAKVKWQGGYIAKLIKEKEALFAQNCEAATRHAGQMDRMQRKLEAATLDRGTCELEINTDMNVIRCSKCGYVVPKGTDLMGVRYCAGCGRKVVDE